MIKNMLFDFDGVILDSMKIKGDGFLELFEKYDKNLLLTLEKYHYQNGGVSRFEKIRYFYSVLLKEKISEEKVGILAESFSKIIEKKLYDKTNLIEETVTFIKKNSTKYRMHIVSGAENAELNRLCRFFDLDRYFLSIQGSPTPKEKLVENLIRIHGYKKDETILIGDSYTDYNAARKNGIDFYGFNNPELKKFKYIESFDGFEL